MGRFLALACLAPVCLALAAGCADTQKVEVAQRARGALVGMPKGTLLSCAGVPVRQANVDGAEFYTYVTLPDVAYGGPTTSIGVAGGSGSGVGIGLGFGMPLFGGSLSPTGCEATFVLRGGVVQQVSYSPRADLAACETIVDRCMATVPPP